MTVAELITELEKLDQDKKISYDYGNPIEIIEIYQGDDAEYTIS